MKKSKKIFAMHDDGLHEAEEIIEIASENQAAENGAEKNNPTDLSAQMDEVVSGLSGVQVGAQVYLVDVRQLEAYPNQPFQQYPLERLQELAEDISRVGVLSPILARRCKNKLQILAGHNRWSAAKLAGLSHVPTMILEADDDQAALILTSTNLRQRERLLPSEKAGAYKMQMDALRRQGSRMPGGYNAAGFITQQTGDSRMQIHRYIRLTELERGLLALVDKGRISMTPAVALSYLSAADQREVLRCVRELNASITINRGNELKRLADNSPEEEIGSVAIMTVLFDKKKADPEYVQIRFDRLKELLPAGLDENGIEAWLLERLGKA